MKKLVLLVMVLLLAVPAVSFGTGCSDPTGCNVSFDVNVYKNKTICEFTYNDKVFFTFANICLEPKALADCEVFKCDYNYSNFVYQTGGILEDTMSGSFNNFTGIGQANQAAGFMVNQGNVVAIAATEGTKKSAAMTEVGVEQTNKYNDYYYSARCYDHNWTTIECSFNGFDGIGQANQSAGSMNNQNNVVAVSAGLSGSGSACGWWGSSENGLLATNDTFLAQNNVDNCATVYNAYNSNLITGSFNGFCGIGQANQATGSMNNQANIVSVSFAGNK
jgi:hypothetical protein